MASRSTRNKIKHQSQEGINAVDRLLVTLKNIDGLADNRSAFINEHLPTITFYVNEVRELLIRFRKGL